MKTTTATKTARFKNGQTASISGKAKFWGAGKTLLATDLVKHTNMANASVIKTPKGMFIVPTDWLQA